MRTEKGRRLLSRSDRDADGGEAFVHDTRRGFVPVEDGDAEAFGQEFVAGATSNDAIGELARDELDVEEIGPFVFVALEDERDLLDDP